MGGESPAYRLGLKSKQMAKKEDLIARLKELAPDLEVKSDHNIADLETFIEGFEAKAKVAELEAEVTEKDELIEQLNQTVAELGSSKESKNPTVSVSKKTYEVLHGVQLVGNEFAGRYTKEEISKDTKLAAFLVEQGSAALVEVKSK